MDVAVREYRMQSQEARYLVEPARTDAVDAFFVFLHLLKRDAEGIRKLCLAQVEHQASHPDPGADVNVGRVGRLSHLISPALTD